MIEFFDENDELHKEDGPAVIWSDGSEFWYLHGQLHRIDGPAIEFPNGYKMWYIDGVEQEEPIAPCNWMKEGF
jgi:hypothetical protein